MPEREINVILSIEYGRDLRTLREEGDPALLVAHQRLRRRLEAEVPWPPRRAQRNPDEFRAVVREQADAESDLAALVTVRVDEGGAAVVELRGLRVLPRGRLPL